jgi:hypothetical protein
MSSKLWKGQAFCVSHADGSGTFKSNFTGGLRAFFEYRNLGVDDATQGKYSANVIRAVPGRHTEPSLAYSLPRLSNDLYSSRMGDF